MKVLIVEDEFLIAQDLQRIVEAAGAEVVVLANSIAGVHQILETGLRVDVCVLDVQLKGEVSLPVIDDLTKRGTACVLVTGYADAGDDDALIVVRKPFEDWVVVASILKALAAARPGPPRA